MNDHEHTIGILGGMGPYAGLDLFKKIHLLTDATTDQQHLPVLLFSCPHRICDRAAFLADPGNPSPVPALVRLAQQMEKAGVTVAGMACNSAHAPAIFDAVQHQLKHNGASIQFVNMIEETARMVQKMQLKTVGVLSAQAVYDLGLYKRALEQAGLSVVRPNAEMQRQLVNPTIFDPAYGIKAHSDPVTDRAQDQLLQAVHHLKDRGAEAVILGCTELPLAIPEAVVDDLHLIDPTEELARALIRRTYPDKLRTARFIE